MEFILYEDKNQEIIGYQIGQNLNYLGVTENAYIIDTNIFAKKLVVTTNVEARKIVYYPHANLEIKSRTDTVLALDNFEILFTDGYKITKNIMINSVSGETR